MSFNFKCFLAGFVIYLGGMGVYTWWEFKDPYQAITDAEVKIMYDNICKMSGQCNSVPDLIIDPSDNVNAYTNGSSVVIYRGLIDKAENEDQVALVLAHEISHVLLKHLDEPGERLADRIRVQEMQADMYGAALALKAGYDVCEGRRFFIVFKNLSGDIMTADHPSDMFRYGNLNFQCGEI